MAEITSGDVTVMVLSQRELGALGSLLYYGIKHAHEHDQWAIDVCHEILESLGVDETP